MSKNKAKIAIGISIAAFVLTFIVATCKYCTTDRTNEETKCNIDSIRRVQRALVDSSREAQCETLEDSVSYYEDGF